MIASNDVLLSTGNKLRFSGCAEEHVCVTRFQCHACLARRFVAVTFNAEQLRVSAHRFAALADSDNMVFVAICGGVKLDSIATSVTTRKLAFLNALLLQLCQVSPRLESEVVRRADPGYGF